MRKKTKKSFLVIIGVALCLAFAGTAFAIDESSLESRTTEGLYDRTDPYDLAMQPGLLYKLDRWRLYTNLSGYSGDDDMASDSYIIGTSGKLGAGSLAVFYETNITEWESANSNADYYYQEYSTAPINYPNYDGTYDYLWDDTDWDKFETKTENNNFHIAYGIDFGGVSVGLSYAPEFEKNETTSGDEGSTSTINYDALDHTLYTLDEDFDSETYKLEADRTEHPFTVQTLIHTADHWHLLVGIGYASIEQQDELSETYSYSHLSEDTNTGYELTENETGGTNGSRDEDYDGDEFSIYLEPVYEVNDMVSLRFDLKYSMQDGDFKGGQVETMNYIKKERVSTGDHTTTDTEYEKSDGSFKGDFEETEWEIEPRVCLTFDKVRFALGIGYHYGQEEWDGTERNDNSYTETHDDGDGVSTVADYTLVKSYTGYENFDGETITTHWRFPVATEFDVTDKLTFRAGAAYNRVRVEEKETETEVDRQNETYTRTDGTGTVIAVGPEQYYDTATSDPTSYDADAVGSSETYEDNRTLDYTTYHLGLGYTFTENLKCDLMWSGNGGGSVDTTRLFASVTLTF